MTVAHLDSSVRFVMLENEHLLGSSVGMPEDGITQTGNHVNANARLVMATLPGTRRI